MSGESKEKFVPERPTVETENLLEVWGYPVSQVFSKKTNQGVLTWKGLDKEVYKVPFRGKGPAWWAYYALGFTDKERNIRDRHIIRSGEEQVKTTTRLFSERCKERDPLLLRARYNKNTDDYVLYTIVTKRWKKITADDLLPEVKKALRDSKLKDFSEVSIAKSDGFSGGSITISGKGKGPIKPSITIDAGKLDGEQSIRGWAGGNIFSCKNQLSMAVRDKLSEALKIGLSVQCREVHTTKPELVPTLINTLMAGVKDMIGYMEVATKVKITEAQAHTILDYYTAETFISAKTAVKIYEKYAGKKYVDSGEHHGTLYGLMMATTEYGTFQQDLKAGVREHTQRMGGELLVVAGHFKEYVELITPIVAEYKKKEGEKAKVVRAESEKVAAVPVAK